MVVVFKVEEEERVVKKKNEFEERVQTHIRLCNRSSLSVLFHQHLNCANDSREVVLSKHR